jgi:hypothetical protein
VPPKPFLSRGPRKSSKGLHTAISLGFGRVIATVIFLESTAIHGLSGPGSSIGVLGCAAFRHKRQAHRVCVQWRQPVAKALCRPLSIVQDANRLRSQPRGTPQRTTAPRPHLCRRRAGICRASATSPPA